jgi:Fe2+ transport system protein FeoA
MMRDIPQGSADGGPPPGARPLDECEPGHCGRVCEVAAGGAEADQLMAMGVCAGRRVQVVKHGDPLILRVLGSRIGVSARLAARVIVVPCPDDWCSSDDAAPES